MHLTKCGVIGIESTLRAGRSGFRIEARKIYLCVVQNVQADSGGSIPGDKAAGA
jgi:hypothetical protein